MLNRLKLTLRDWWYFLSDSRFRRLKRSGLFNPEYYLITNPDVAGSGISPLAHYLYGGWKEGRRPNAFFSPLFYMSQCSDGAESGKEPLLHYFEDGWRKNCEPSLLFWSKYYMEQQPVLSDSIGNPLVHFFNHGWRQGRNPSPYHDLNYYRQKYRDVDKSWLTPLQHYSTFGIRQNRRPGPFFDIDWYIDKTPVLRDFQGDILNHYFEHGIFEGKSPLPLFDPDYYAANNTDITKTEDDLFAHYLKVGMAEDLKPCDYFDPKFYRKCYPEVNRLLLSPLQHYLESGVYEGYYVNRKIKELPLKPLVSIVVPVYNVDDSFLNNCIRSVLYQSYPHWQLCLADDCSDKPNVRANIKKWNQVDSRIKVVFLDKNRGISGATNKAVSIADGDYIGFLDNDDELDHECLYEIVRTICQTGADLLYTDEDLIGDDGKRFSIFHKPAFNKELLYCHNYITHFVAVKKEMFKKVGGLADEYNGAQDFDLFLKLSEVAQQISHIPKVLYHWRAIKSSTSINHGQKEYANEAGRKAVSAAMNRNGIIGGAENTDWKFYYRARRASLSTKETVSVVIHVEEKTPELIKLIGGLFESEPSIEIQCIVLLPEKTSLYDAILALNKEILVLDISPGEKKGSLLNRAATHCLGNYLVFLDKQIVSLSTGWLEALLEYGLDEQFGLIGGRIRPIDDQMELNLTIPDITNPSPVYYSQFFQGCSTHLNGLECPQEVLSVSPSFFMISKKLFEAFHGFDDTNYPDLFYLHDLGLRLYEKGYKNVYTPFCIAKGGSLKLCGSERETVGKLDKELSQFQTSWKVILNTGDPYWNRAILTKHGIDPAGFIAWYTGDSRGIDL